MEESKDFIRVLVRPRCYSAVIRLSEIEIIEQIDDRSGVIQLKSGNVVSVAFNDLNTFCKEVGIPVIK